MARALDPIDGDSFDPVDFSVTRLSNQIVVTVKNGADAIELKFDNRDQAHQLLRDIILQVNSLG